MSLREWMLAGLLAVAGACVVVGLWRVNESAGWVGGGVLLAVWSWSVFADDSDAPAVADAGDDG